MSEKHSVDKLIGVPRTLLVPLYGRYAESLRDDAIIHDEYAIQAIESIDYDFSVFEQDHPSNLGIAVRTEIFDELTQDFIQRHPNGTIVNLGAGVDARFYRLDNGQINWIDLDLPESMDIRRKFLNESPPRHRFLTKSVLDLTWPDEVQHTPALFIAEGLFIYFDESDVKTVLTALAERFPQSEMLLEVIGRSMAQNTQDYQGVASTHATFRWGIRHAERIANWHPKIHYLTDISIYDRYQARWLDLPIKWGASLADLRNTPSRIVHLRFG